MCLQQQEGGKHFLSSMFGTQSFLGPVWQPPGAQTVSLKNLQPYGKNLAYFIQSVDLLKIFLSLD